MPNAIKVPQPLRKAVSVRRAARGRAAGLALVMAICFSLALLGSQTLGLLHGIVHGPAAAGYAAAREPSSHQHAVAAENGDISNASFLAQLFSGHLGEADCHAYDQLSHFDAALGCLAPVLPLVLTPFLLSNLTGLATARWHALFQARGPPSLR